MSKKKQKKRFMIILGIYISIIILNLISFSFSFTSGNREYFVSVSPDRKHIELNYDYQPFTIQGLIGSGYEADAIYCSDDKDCSIQTNYTLFSGTNIFYTELEDNNNVLSIDVDNNNINQNELNNILTEYTQIESLNLYNRGIDSITGLDKLTNLTDLSLSSNEIDSITGLDSLTNLTDLDLSDNNIDSITGLDKLTNLTDLDLSHNNINTIENIEKLDNLQQLDLYDTNITSITQASLDYIEDNNIIVSGVEVDDLEIIEGGENV